MAKKRDPRIERLIEGAGGRIPDPTEGVDARADSMRRRRQRRNEPIGGPQPGKDQLSRGVWVPPVLDEGGHREVWAVSRDGRRVYTARVFRGDRMEDVKAMVHRLLDQLDPVRR